MAKTANELIVDGFREGNLIAVGDAPTTAERDEALPLLNSFIKKLAGRTVGEFLMDWPVPPSRTSPVAAQYPLYPESRDLPLDVYPYPPDNVRLITKLATATTVYLPSHPRDGARFAIADIGSVAGTPLLTLDGNGRRIEGSLTQLIDTENVGQRQWIYRADLAAWRRFGTLALTDESPFPDEYDDLLSCGLAMRLAGRHRQEVPSTVRETYGDLLSKMKVQYRQVREQPTAWDPRLLTIQTYGQGSYDGTGTIYNG